MAATHIRPQRISRRLRDDFARVYESDELQRSRASHRSSTLVGVPIQVLWNERWFAANVLEDEDDQPTGGGAGRGGGAGHGGRVLVSYIGHDDSWRRWVERGPRIRPQLILKRPESLEPFDDSKFPKPGDRVACLSVCRSEGGCFQARRITPVGVVLESRPEWGACYIELTQIHDVYCSWVSNEHLFTIDREVFESFRELLELIRDELALVRDAAEDVVVETDDKGGARRALQK